MTNDTQNTEGELDAWFYRHASEEADGTQTLILHETHGWEGAPKQELQQMLATAHRKGQANELELCIDQLNAYSNPNILIKLRQLWADRLAEFKSSTEAE
jgi:hypothetical protein